MVKKKEEIKEEIVSCSTSLLRTYDVPWVWKGMTNGDMIELLIQHRMALDAYEIDVNLTKGQNCGS